MCKCKYGYSDCEYENNKCNICFDGAQYVRMKKPKKTYRLQKHSSYSNRKGARFEQKNHQLNQAYLQSDTYSAMTPNSGAGRIKGDEEIRGLINIMEECKTRTVVQARGKEQFTIKKEWLSKLDKEARQANKEFWYLKFSFHEAEDDIYCVVDANVLLSMVQTLQADRKKVNVAQQKIDAANARAKTAELENSYLKAKIEELTVKEGEDVSRTN